MSENKVEDSSVAQAIKDKVLESSRDLASKLPVVGNVAWLYMRSQIHKHYFLQDMESRVLPPVMKGQCKLYLQTKTGGLPMAFVSWAYLSEEAEENYCATQRIAPKDWNSGENIWLVDMIAPHGGEVAIVKELYHKIFEKKAIHTFYPDEDGNLQKTTLQALAEKLRVDQTANDADENTPH